MNKNILVSRLKEMRILQKEYYHRNETKNY